MSFFSITISHARVEFEFLIHKKTFFSLSMSHAIFGTYTKKKMLAFYLKFKSNWAFLILLGDSNWAGGSGEGSQKSGWVLVAARGCCSVVALLSGSVASPVPSPVVTQSRTKVTARGNKTA